MDRNNKLILCAAGLALLMAVCGVFLSGILRMLALGALYFAEMEALMLILYPVQKRPELSKEERIKAEDQWYFDRQDPEKMGRMRRVGMLLNGIALALTLAAALFGGGNPLWAMLCMGCSLASVALCILQPAYFALCHSEKEKKREHGFPIVNLIVPYACPLLGSAFQFRYTVAIADWMGLVEVMLIAGAVIGTALRLLAAECRRNTGNWILALILACLCAFGFVMPVNGMLETETPQTVSGVVTERDRGGRRSPTVYKVLLESGEMVDIPVNGRSYPVDTEIDLLLHSGGLGIEYYTYAD